jgi:hypothetical protein
MKTFRAWCYEKWLEHCDEVEAWTKHSVGYLSQEYFNKYKWWLKREYRSTKFPNDIESENYETDF